MMVNMRAAHTLPFIIVVVLCADACTTTLSLLEHDPGFSYSALADAGLGIGGVTSLVSGNQNRMETSSQMASMLQRALVAKRRDVNVVPWGEIRRRLGDEEMSAGLQSFEELGDLAGERLSIWGASLHGSPQYVVLARVEENTTSIDDEGDDPFIEDGAQISVTATRSVTVAFSIYDIRSGIRVWRADINGELGYPRFYQYREATVIVRVRPPDPPDFEVLVEDIFDRFGEEIPAPPE